MITMMMAVILGGMARGDETEQVERLLALVDRQNESLRLSVDREEETVEELASVTRAWQRAQVEAFIGRVRGLKAKVGVYLEAIEVLKETGGLEEAEEFVEGSAMCLFEEANLRAQWRALVKMPMTQETRDEAGKVWVEMTAQIDALAKVLEGRTLSVPDQRLVDEWKAARAAPPAPEPEIVAE
jgi:hypothetical protein